MTAAPRRIGVNAVFLEPGMGGLETYIRELVPRMAEQAPQSTIKVLCNDDGRRLLEGEGWDPAIKLVTPRALTRRGLRAATELTLAGAWASRSCDALLSPALTAPLHTRAANVVLLADVTWLLFPDLGDGGSATLRLWRAIVPTVARRADRVIALTHAGAEEVEQRLGVRSERIDVVGLGFDSMEQVAPTPELQLRSRLGIHPGDIVLNVAAKKAHKNQMVLVDAAARLATQGTPISLVLAGAPTPYQDELRRRSEELGVADRVCLPGFVDESDLEGLYAAAGCLAFPSLNEGFGLPLIEAMARDVPVVCSDIPVLREVVGEAAVLVDPRSAESVAAGVGSVLNDGELRAHLIVAGKERIGQFTWDRVAAQTIDSLSRAVAEKGV